VSGSPKHSVSVSAVIVDDEQRVLLMQRCDTGEWQIPGGVLELDEDVHAGLRREVREETGLQVESVRLSGVYKNMPLGVVALVFRCRPLGGTLTTSDETRALAWASSSEVSRRMTDAFAIRVLDALKTAAQIPVRAHNGRRLLT
jgi:8-oxo-dGTP diphosphatase